MEIEKKIITKIVTVLNKVNKDISLKLNLDQETYNRCKNLELELNAKVKFLDMPTIYLDEKQVKTLNKVFGKISESFAVEEMKLSDERAKEIWKICYYILSEEENERQNNF